MNAEFVAPDESYYDDMLDDVHYKVKIGHLEFWASTILKELDPTAYEIGFSEFCDENGHWKCTECGAEYDNEEEAEECCRDKTKLDL